MRRILLFSYLLCCMVASAIAQSIHSVKVKAELQSDGTAFITQDWDATVVFGTEWYIPIGNLKNMYVDNLTVEENGVPYISEGDDWDVDRSLSEKKGRCGIVRKSGNDVELCWGQGSYDRHLWRARFRVSGLVQRLNDYDAFNFMFINPKLVAGPEEATVVIENHTGSTEWTSENTKVWSFGFHGEIHVIDGKIVATTSEPMSRNSKIIIMVRFDRGMFNPSVSRDIPFEEMREIAFDGSDYDGGDSSMSWEEMLVILGLGFLLVLFIFWAIYIGIRLLFGYKYEKSLLGESKITGWYREAPLEGNLFAAMYVLQKGSIIGDSKSSENIVGALFLKWILNGIVECVPDEKKPDTVNLVFSDKTFEEPMDKAEAKLYSMASEASGDNLILEKDEFKKWSKRKYKKMIQWSKDSLDEGKRFLMEKAYIDAKAKGTETGKEEMRHVIEFKNFLKDFTQIDERAVIEVGLWKDYLVFAQLFGIADRVFKQLSALYPAKMKEFTESVHIDDRTLLHTIIYSNMMARSAMVQATTEQASREGSSGGGGSSSWGGGGGFSGGGCGGGSR